MEGWGWFGERGRGWGGDEVEVRWRRGGGEVAVSSQGRQREGLEG